MRKLILLIALILLLFNVNLAQKHSATLYHSTGAPSSCILGRGYINDITGHLYTYKIGVGCYDLTTAGLAGSGTSGQIALWNGTSSLSGNTGFTFTGTGSTFDLTIGRLINAQIFTGTPQSDVITGVFRRNSSSQTSNIVEFQSELNATLSAIDKSGNFTGNSATTTNGIVSTGSYANPSWISSLAWSKLTSTPTTLSGYGITDSIVLTTNSYANPTWITSLAYSKLTGTPTAGATVALDNLASVNINSVLLAQIGIDLGSTTKPFRDLFLSGNGTYGTNYFRFTGTPTNTRTITFPDASITVARTDAAQTFTGTQSFGAIAASGNVDVGAGGRYSYNTQFQMTGNTLYVGSAVNIGFSSNTSVFSAGMDTAIGRNAAGVIEVNNGTSGNIRDLRIRTTQLGSTTVRPTCDSTTRGDLYHFYGGTGIKDTVDICTKDASDVYAWRSIY